MDSNKIETSKSTSTTSSSQDKKALKSPHVLREALHAGSDDMLSSTDKLSSAPSTHIDSHPKPSKIDSVSNSKSNGKEKNKDIQSQNQSSSSKRLSLTSSSTQKKQIPGKKHAPIPAKVSISWGNWRELSKPFLSSHSPLLSKPLPFLAILLIPTIVYYTLGSEGRKLRGIFFLIIVALCWRYFLKSCVNKRVLDSTPHSDWGQEYLKGRVTIKFSLAVDGISKYLENKAHEMDRKDVNITHLAIKAVGLALKETPELNGHTILNTFYPAKTIDVSCEVRQEDGTSALLKVFEVDKKSVSDIYFVLSSKTKALRQDQDIFLTRRNAIINSFPVLFLPGLVDFLDASFTFISSTLGISIPYLGIKSFPQGVCTVIPPKPYTQKKSSKNGSENGMEVIVERDQEQEKKSLSSRGSMVLTIGGLEIRPQIVKGNSVPYLLPYLNFSLVVQLDGGGSTVSVRKFSDKLQSILLNPTVMDEEIETKKEI